MKRKPNIKQLINAYSLIAFFYIIAYTPLLVQKALAKLLATLTWHLIPSRNKIAQRNIALCFPNLNSSEQFNLAKQTFYSNMLGYFQTASAWCRPPNTFEHSVTFSGIECFNDAIKSNQGVLLVGGHFTILDLAGSLLSSATDYHTVHRRHNNPILNNFMIKSRTKFTQSCIDRKDIKSMIRTLKQGNVMWYAPDQDYGRKDSIFVPFFNTQAATITATTRLSKISRAHVIFTSYFEVSHGKYEIRFFKPENFPSGNDEQDAIIYNQWLQSEIEQFPSQYLWLHKRFKTRPIGEKTLY